MQPASTDYKPPIRGFLAVILRLILQLSTVLPSRINDPETRQMAVGLLGSANDTFQALSDNDPNDGAQLRAALNKLLTNSEFAEGSRAELLALVSNVQDEDLRLALSVAVNQAYPIADKLTDDNDANGEQLKAYVQGLLQSPDGVAFISAILNLVLPNGWGQTISLLVIQTLLELLSQGDDDETPAQQSVRIRNLQAIRQMAVERENLLLPGAQDMAPAA
ncbi:MAG: hypothetical protein AAFY91_10700 [Bacteroidota bacterium]